ncbi:MAG: RagB/SusD family nutrient uptake outer membrane protein [Candidatus Cyclobacteriaceae bacterium M3_2C_046]
MKTNYVIIKKLRNLTYTLLALMLFSCGEDFIDLAPISDANINNFYKTPADFENAVNGVYASLQAPYGDFFNFSGIRSDQGDIQNTTGSFYQQYDEFDQFFLDPANPIIQRTWTNYYQTIGRANTVLDRIGGITITESLANRLEGEARFLRALAYFDLVRIFGDVPLVTNEVNDPLAGLEQERNAASQVYDQIIADLEEAASLLPNTYTGDDIGRATSFAAKALLGKVYLTNQQPGLAETTLKDVIDNGGYSLLDDYAAIFDVNNANHAESVFEIQYKSGLNFTGSGFTNLFAPGDSKIVPGDNQGFNRPTADFLASYTENDLRKDKSVSFYSSGDGAIVDEPYTVKYMSNLENPYDSDNNWIVLRYADVLLMYAEALLENGKSAEAIDALNEVHAHPRTGLDAYTSIELSSDELIEQAIRDERNIELAFEGHRWFDLVRWDIYMEVMNAHTGLRPGVTVEAHHRLFPIPQAEIDINPDGITQNDNY